MLFSLLREQTWGRRRELFRKQSRNAVRKKQKNIHPVTFIGTGCAIAAVIMLVSTYTIGTTVTYDGEEIGTVASKSSAENARMNLEQVTTRTLGESFTIDESLIQYSSGLLKRQDVVDESTFEEGLSEEIGIKVFFGIEMSYKGTDFLVYGLDKSWYLSHPEIMDMKRSELLAYLQSHGALVIQAHPFREANYIDHIRLFPRQVHGIEILNASRPDFENNMAAYYAEYYGLIPFAGSDNHRGAAQKRLAGMESEVPVGDELDFVAKVMAGQMRVFSIERSDEVE
jgi:hypothetical protein